MKSAATQRKKLKSARNQIAQIARQVRGQVQLDRMLSPKPDRERKILFKAMRPYLPFDAIYPTPENTAVVTPESFAQLREKYAAGGK